MFKTEGFSLGMAIHACSSPPLPKIPYRSYIRKEYWGLGWLGWLAHPCAIFLKLGNRGFSWVERGGSPAIFQGILHNTQPARRFPGVEMALPVQCIASWRCPQILKGALDLHAEPGYRVYGLVNIATALSLIIIIGFLPYAWTEDRGWALSLLESRVSTQIHGVLPGIERGGTATAFFDQQHLF
jgi:hypothetical protein